MFSSKKRVDKLNASSIHDVIAFEYRCFLGQMDIFNSIGSTNTYLLECARTGGTSGWVCIADHQTKGRGRHGRQWCSPRGTNLYFSMLWHFPVDQKNISALSIAVAVTIANVLKKMGVQESIELKWPNDILFSGKKLAGILLESLPAQQGQIPVVIGVGLNIEPWSNPEINGIGLAEMIEQPISRNQLAGLIINELLKCLTEYAHFNVEPFLESWKTHDALYNKIVNVITPTRTIVGVAKGINSKGELILAHEMEGLLLFRCGEVSVRKNDCV